MRGRIAPRVGGRVSWRSWVPQEEGEEELLEQGCQTGSPSPEIRDVDGALSKVFLRPAQHILLSRGCPQPILKMGKLRQAY